MKSRFLRLFLLPNFRDCMHKASQKMQMLVINSYLEVSFNDLFIKVPRPAMNEMISPLR